ncbi:MAG TPA: hypothetical protein VLK85_04595 [Ramlibacter sp.]|nr:hypothetical protein [Ramlibacter sp.]
MSEGRQGDRATARRAYTPWFSFGEVKLFQRSLTSRYALAPRLLRDVLGNLLPDSQERRYRRILGFKDEVQYGTRQASRDEAARLLSDLEEFARWADDML